MNKRLVQDFLRMLPNPEGLSEQIESLDQYNANGATRSAFETAVKVRVTGRWPDAPALKGNPESVEKGMWSPLIINCTET